MKDNEQKKLAVFDVDGTIFRSSLIVELVEALIEQGLFPGTMRHDYVREYRNWVDRKGEYEPYIDALVESFMKNIRGVSFEDFSRVAREVVAYQKNRVYRYTRDLLKELHEKGYYCVAISQSPKAILEEFCKNIGFDKVYGRIYEVGPENRFLGTVSDLHLIANKANIIRRVLANENLTLSGSVGVGDTDGDISMLELVEEPICFNPNKKLFAIAKLNNWKVVVERKDVIYTIDTTSKHHVKPAREPQAS